jgi:ATP/maltotriose-dependent transcriptional regulator MalT
MAAPLLFRRRIVNLIEESPRHIVYIFGPAGYGKTVVAKQWAESQDIPTAWFDGYSTTNAADLLITLLESIFKVIPSLKTKFREIEIPEKLDLKILNEVISVLEKSKIELNLIIDNAELIRKSHNDFSRYLVSECPANIKLVLLTNTSPRTSFLKEHGTDRFTVISPLELAFSFDETKQLTYEFNSQLSDKDISKVQTLTEGWPAGVHIALSQANSSEKFDELISSLKTKGKQRFSAASQRILANLEDNELDILCSLAWLDEIDAEAAYHLTEDVNAVRILTVLSQESVIVAQTGFSPPNFKIHPILRQALLDELQTRKDFTEKSERVVSFLLNRGDVRSLTRVLLELGEVKRLSALLVDPVFAREIDASIQDAIARSAIDDLRNWVSVTKYVPELGDKARLILNFYIELLSGNLKEAESNLHALRDAIEKLNAKDSIQWWTDLYALESISHYARGRLNDAFHLAMQAYQHASQQPASVRGHQISYLQFALTKGDSRKQEIIL